MIELPEEHFDFIFVDEAGYLWEPELIPILACLKSSGTLILAGHFQNFGQRHLNPFCFFEPGDPQQLSPVVHHPIFKTNPSFSQSTLESDN